MLPTPPKFGLSLSGGGYRAAAFHLGTLKALNKMGILSKADVLSTISGGSITGAYYCLKKEDFGVFEASLYDKLQHGNVVKRILLSFTFLKTTLFALIFLVPAIYFLFTPHAWLSPLVLLVFVLLLSKFQFYIFPVSKRIEKIYDTFFYEGRSLEELPERPVLVLGSTNLQTARAFTFSRNWMQDSTYQYMNPRITFKAASFPIARAVMASSCVPFAFTPITIDKKYFTDEADAKRVHPVLVDGGVYDNQGIHKIMQKGQYACDLIVTSDASAGNNSEGKFKNTLAILLTTVNVFMSRIKKAQMVEDVYDNAATANKQIAYFSLGWDAENCIPGFIDNLAKKQIAVAVIAAHKLEEAWVENPDQYRNEITQYLQDQVKYAEIDKPTPEEKKIARNVGTNLTSLSKREVDCLIKQAMALTELQVKLYCPGLQP